MRQSTNYKANLPEGNNVIDISVLNKNITDIIDKGLILDVGDSTGNANNYVLNLGSITLSSANKGISFKFWADKNSTGAVKINGTYKLIKASGSSVTNLKAGAPYIITYDGGTNFFLASGGGLDTVNFTSDKLLTGYSANDSNGEKVNGTMPNKGTVTQTLSVNGSLTLPSGYYDSIKITQNIPNRGEYQMAGGVGSGTDYIALNKIPYGYYPQSSNGWAPEIRAKKTDVANHIGLTANKIVAGNTICGVTGNVTIQSLGGYSKSDIKNKGIITRYKVVKQSETPLNLNGKTNSMYVVLQKKVYYVRDSGNKYCEIFCIDNNLNNLIFLESKGTASTKYNKDYYEFLQYVNLNNFTTTSYESDTYLPYDQVGQGKKYHLIPLEGNTKYGKLVVDQHRTNGDSSNNSWCETSTIRLQTKVLTYDLLTLDHYGWLFNYSSSSDRFTTIVNKREGSKNVQYKTEYQIVPEVVDKDGNVIS